MNFWQYGQNFTSHHLNNHIPSPQKPRKIGIIQDSNNFFHKNNKNAFLAIW